jgi:hypothetical protein
MMIMRGHRVGARLIELDEELPEGADVFEVMPVVPVAATGDELEAHLRRLEADGDLIPAPADAEAYRHLEPIVDAAGGLAEFLSERR